MTSHPIDRKPSGNGDLLTKAKQTATHSPEVQRLLDRQAILDCVHRYCRGVDRHDYELLRSVFHPDALDQHGDFVGGVPAFLKFAEEATSIHAGSVHHITCHFCEFDGDTAHAESYVLSVSREKDGKTAMVLGGRYLDRFEKRNGEWKIALRRVVRDFRFDGDTARFVIDQARQTDAQGFPLGRRDSGDLSYQRPLAPPDLADKGK
jgi:ketosteroid isomerase-like protein